MKTKILDPRKNASPWSGNRKIRLVLAWNLSSSSTGWSNLRFSASTKCFEIAGRLGTFAALTLGTEDKPNSLRSFVLNDCTKISSASWDLEYGFWDCDDNDLKCKDKTTTAANRIKWFILPTRDSSLARSSLPVAALGQTSWRESGTRRRKSFYWQFFFFHKCQKMKRWNTIRNLFAVLI